MIEVKNLTKKYGDHIAVSNLTFTVKDGQIYGFLGPNGAGKTTTMNIITGYMGTTMGTVVIDGHDIFEEPTEAKKLIGYLPEQPPLYNDMTTREYLQFAAELKGVAKPQRKEQVASVMERTQITDMADRLLKHLSKGYRQRVGLAQALIGNPSVLILDEPTVGLDPKQIIEIRDLIKSLGSDHTVILSSHILSEVQAVCDHILIISHGKLVASDTPENLSRLMSSSNVVTLEIKGDRQSIAAAVNTVARVNKCEITPAEKEGVMNVTVESDADVDLSEPLFFALSDAHCVILQMDKKAMSLEDVFLTLTDDTPEFTPDDNKEDAK